MVSFEEFGPVASASDLRARTDFGTFIDALEQVESSGGKHLWNARTGATGPLQVTPIAAKDVGEDYSRAIDDHAYARGVGVKYAKKLWDMFQGEPSLVAAAYHTGPTQVRKWIQEAGESDAVQYVRSKLGREGRGHNEGVLSKLGVAPKVASGDTRYDPETGEFTSRDPESPRGAVPGRESLDRPVTFGDFTDPPVDRGIIKTLASKFAEDYPNTTEFVKGAAATANLVTGMPGFILGSLAAHGSATVGLVGRAMGYGKSDVTGYQEPVADITKRAQEHGEQVSATWEKYFNPIAMATHILSSPEGLNDTVVNKAMGELMQGVKNYSRHIEKSTGNKVDAGAIEISLNSALATAIGKSRGQLPDRGLENRVTYNSVQNKWKAENTTKAPTFADFSPEATIREANDVFDTVKADNFIQQALAESAKAEAKKGLHKKIALGAGGAAIGAGGVALYNQLQKPDAPIDVPEPAEGNEIALNQIGSFLSESSPEWDKLAPMLLAAGAVKPKGGIWHQEAVKVLAAPLKDKLYTNVRGIDPAITPENQAAAAWSDRAIRNYLNKHAGTVTDPLKDVEIPYREGTKRWEELMDASIAENFQMGPRGKETAYNFGPATQRGELIKTPEAITSYLSHVGDYLRQNVDPAKLQQYDLVRAVKETAANDARVAKEMEKAASASMKDLPVYKDYSKENPGSLPGMKWVELKLPEKLTSEQMNQVRPAKLRETQEGLENQGPGGEHVSANTHEPFGYVAHDASGKPIRNSYTDALTWGKTPEEAFLAGKLAEEGNQMGHCVGGYCEGVASGESRIFSLRDAKGKSHVTVEVAPPDVRVPTNSPEHFARVMGGKWLDELNKVIAQTHSYNAGPDFNRKVIASPEYQAWIKQQPNSILQIKGKQNRAPVAEYLPYVQDFVKSGKWGKVGDLQNTGLKKRGDKYLNESEYLDARIAELEARIKQPGPQGVDPESGGLPIRDVLDRLKSQREAQRGPRNQAGFADPRLLKAMAIAGVGAVIGATVSEADRQLLGAIIGGAGALGLNALGGKVKAGRTPIESLDYGLGVISTRLRNISEPLRFRAVDYERRVLRDVHHAFDEVHPFLKALSEVPKNALAALNRAIISNDAGAIHKIMRQVGNPELIRGWQQTRRMLNELGERWKGQGRISELLADYFPRIVKDKDGLMQALGNDFRPEMEKALREAELAAIKSRGTGLSQLEESIIINRMLRNWRQNSGRLGPARARRVEEVTNAIVGFYATPAEALHSYISIVTRDLEKAKFFGQDIAEKKVGDVTYLDLDTSIGNVVRRELDEGRISDKQAEELQSIIKSRFTTGEQGPTSWVQDIKNVANAGLLGNIVSAMTQFGDAAVPIALHGLRPTLATVIRNVTGNSKVNVRDFGLIDHIAEEFASTRTSQKALNNLFKFSGFTAIDRFGKNVLLGSALERMQAEARTPKGRSKLAQKYGEALREEFPGLIADLLNKRKSDTVNSVLFAELSDVQPITRMEVPQGYLDHPNGRILYMLKTFMIKQADLVRREGYNKIKEGKVAEGVGFLAKYGLVLGISGATTDQIKGWFQWKNDPFEARDVWMNMLKTFGWSEYTLDKAIRQGKPLEAMVGAAVPPYKMMDDILRADPKAVRYIPVIGPLWEARVLGGGQRAQEGKANRDMMRLVDPETSIIQKRKKEGRDKLYRMYQAGDEAGFEQGLEEFAEKYELTNQQQRAIRSNAKLPADVRKFKTLPLEQQRVILEKASPEMVEKLMPHAKKGLRN